MINNDFNLPYDLYVEHLAQISHVKFTQREIDVIAFLVNGRSTKKIASFFKISPKTVANHVRNIMIKLDCNSREGIVDFVGSSQKLSIIREYYSVLLLNAKFEGALREIAALNRKDQRQGALIYGERQEHPLPIIRQIQTHLKQAGLNVSALKENKDGLYSRNALEYIIYVTPDIETEGFRSMFLAEETTLQTNIQRKKNVIFLIEEDNVEHLQKLKDYKIIHLNTDQTYYDLIFILIKTIYSNQNFDKLIQQFTEFYKSIGESETIKNIQGQPVEYDLKNTPSVFKQYSLQTKRWVIVSAIISIGLILVGLFIIKYFELTRNNKGGNHDQVHGAERQTSNVIRSDLALPSKSVFLNRSDLIEQIGNKLNGKGNIQTVALVGIGGSGKTTLARQYARSQSDSVVWEVDSETKEVLSRSFDSLSRALAETDEDKMILRGFQETKDPKEKEEKTIQFVKEKLRNKADWLLIYDNVETFTTIQKHLPHDPNTWGSGKIIITTRNSTIQNNKYVDSIISVGELNDEQRVNLFHRIMRQENVNSYSKTEEQKTKKFLKKIPPFPLDISIAAYYLTVTNASYDNYLEILVQDGNNHDDIQENLLKEAGDYTRTRYGIITLSVRHFMDIDKNFTDLLLLISLLDSQHIPRELLISFKGAHLVDNFIYNLKKYSLIAGESGTAVKSIPTLSIHRSTQAITLSYLKKTLELAKDNKPVKLIAGVLEKYLAEVIEKEDFSRMTLMINHSEIFLNHTGLLPEAMKGAIEGELGGVYSHLGTYSRSLHLLEKGLFKLRHNDKFNFNAIAQVLSYLGVVHREIGNYEKAKNYLEQSYVIYGKYPGNGDAFARALTYLGTVYRELGEHEKSRQILEESLVTHKNYFLKNPAGRARILADLGNAYRSLGDYEKAKTLLEQSVSIYEEQLSKDHFRVAWTLIHLSNIHRSLGDYKQAKGLIERALSICRKHSSVNYVGLTWMSTRLGIIEKELGNYKSAQSILEKSFGLHKKFYGTENIRTAWTAAILGNVYIKLGNLEKAKELLEWSKSKHVQLYGNENIRTAWASIQLGHVYEKLNDTRQARLCYEKSYEVYKPHYKEGHLKLAAILVGLANVYKNQSDYEKAKALLEQTMLVYTKHYGHTHIETARVLADLGEVYFLEGNLDKAEGYLNDSLTIFLQNSHPDSYIPLERLADLYLQKSLQAQKEGNDKRSKSLKKQANNALKQAFKIVSDHFPKDSHHFVRIQNKADTPSWMRRNFLMYFQNLLNQLVLRK